MTIYPGAHISGVEGEGIGARRGFIRVTPIMSTHLRYVYPHRNHSTSLSI